MKHPLSNTLNCLNNLQTVAADRIVELTAQLAVCPFWRIQERRRLTREIEKENYVYDVLDRAWMRIYRTENAGQ